MIIVNILINMNKRIGSIASVYLYIFIDRKYLATNLDYGGITRAMYYKRIAAYVRQIVVIHSEKKNRKLLNTWTDRDQDQVAEMRRVLFEMTKKNQIVEKYINQKMQY